MPRPARLVIPTLPHHITQRGNYRQEVFQKEADFKKYCRWMSEYSKKYGLDILAYCLMNNHVHFIAVPRAGDSLARTFNTVHMRYSQYKNGEKRQKGHLWQGRFYSCLLDEEHLYRAIRYVERNPVRAKIVREPGEYGWSSARYHLGEVSESDIRISGDKIMDVGEWRQYLQDGDERMCAEIRLKTLRGLVVGGEEFIARLEQKFHRSLACLNPGRPKKRK